MADPAGHRSSPPHRSVFLASTPTSSSCRRSPQLLWIVLQDHQQVLGFFVEVTRIQVDHGRAQRQAFLGDVGEYLLRRPDAAHTTVI